jgi:hypothetical protein
MSLVPTPKQRAKLLGEVKLAPGYSADGVAPTAPLSLAEAIFPHLIPNRAGRDHRGMLTQPNKETKR